MWTDFLTPLRILLRGLALLLILLTLMPVTVLCQSPWAAARKRGGRGLDERSLGFWSRCLLRVFGVRLLQRGAVVDGPLLVVANHISWLDIMALHGVAAMGFVAKAEIRDWPVLGFLATRGGTIYHRRGSHDSSTGVMHAMLTRLQQGGRVAVFPEGGILPGEHISPFHARMFAVAVEAGCPVQPVMLRYLRDGRRDPDLTFLRGENFVGNLFRLLGRPGCLVELVCMAPFAVAGRPRRELAEQAFKLINEAYEAGLK